MIPIFRKVIRSINRGQGGQILILVLILLILGSLMIAPLLSFMATGLKSNQVFDKKTDVMYAADAGIQHANGISSMISLPAILRMILIILTPTKFLLQLRQLLLFP